MTSPMPSTSAGAGHGPTYIQYGWEKCKRQPLVPIGAAATTVALLGATASLRSGNRKQFQSFLRLRVAAQGLTVLAMVVGAYMLTTKAEDAKEARHRALTGQRPSDLVLPSEPEVDETAQFYPPREKTKVSDFTRRLREAEEQHKADTEARKL